MFQGGLQTIQRDQPIIFSEILRKWSAKFDYNPNEIFTLLRSLGYGAYTAEQRCLHCFDRMTEATVETNFFFLHDIKHRAHIDRQVRR